MSARDIADQLDHARLSMTQDVYTPEDRQPYDTAALDAAMRSASAETEPQVPVTVILGSPGYEPLTCWKGSPE